MPTITKEGGGALGALSTAITYSKEGKGRLGAAGGFHVKAGGAVTVLTGSATDALEYSETNAGAYNPFVWMDMGLDAATLIFTGSGSRLSDTSRFGTGILALVGEGARNTVTGKPGGAIIELTGGGTKTVTQPIIFTKAGTGTLEYTIAASIGSHESGDARRSLRWINRQRRRDTW